MNVDLPVREGFGKGGRADSDHQVYVSVHIMTAVDQMIESASSGPQAQALKTHTIQYDVQCKLP
jgi:hypothetical protein